MNNAAYNSSILEQGQYLAPVSCTKDLEGLLAGTTEYPSPLKTGRWHAHENPMISFVLEGGNIENRKSRQLHRKTGSINFYHAFEPHQNIYKVFPSRHFSIEISPSFLSMHGIYESRIYEAVEKNPFTKFIFLQIIREVLLNDEYSEDSAQMLFLELAQTPSLKINSEDTPNWVSQLRNYMNENWAQTISLAELSGITGIHPVTISGNFRTYFGSTFGEYMRKLKVNRAIALIKDSPKQLTEIAYVCGFADHSHFTRTFKEQTGFLPKDYQAL